MNSNTLAIWITVAGLIVVAVALGWHFLGKKKDAPASEPAHTEPWPSPDHMIPPRTPRPVRTPAAVLAEMAGADAHRFSAPFAEGESPPSASLSEAVAPEAARRAGDDRIAAKRFELKKLRDDIDAKLAKLDEIESHLDKL